VRIALVGTLLQFVSWATTYSGPSAGELTPGSKLFSQYSGATAPLSGVVRSVSVSLAHLAFPVGGEWLEVQ